MIKDQQAVEQRIQSFLERKTRQYPEINRVARTIYR